jgi:hypothetical protein
MVIPGIQEILTSITGVAWDEAWAGSVPGNYDEIPVRYLGKEQYRTNKLALGRTKDLADLETLEE